jgi:hypothetical protein
LYCSTRDILLFSNAYLLILYVVVDSFHTVINF